LHDGHDVLDIVSGIDDDGFLRLLIADDGAIALKGTYGKNLVNHDFTLSRMPKFLGQRPICSRSKRALAIFYKKISRSSAHQQKHPLPISCSAN
jgi:hypothetical protein